MRCKTFEHRISDGLDGRLSDKRRRRLDSHLAGCAKCRAYKSGLEKIQAVSRAPVEAGLSPEDFARSLSRLKTALQTRAGEDFGKSRWAPGFFGPARWAWTGGAAVLLLAAGLYFWPLRGLAPQDIYLFAETEALASFNLSMAEDPDLAEAMGSAVQSSLIKAGDETRLDVEPLIADHTLFVESLTDDEVDLLEAVLWEEIVI